MCNTKGEVQTKQQAKGGEGGGGGGGSAAEIVTGEQNVPEKQRHASAHDGNHSETGAEMT